MLDGFAENGYLRIEILVIGVGHKDQLRNQLLRSRVLPFRSIIFGRHRHAALFVFRIP